MTPQPFNIHEAVGRLRRAVAPLPKAALFQLVDEGYGAPFQVLAACIISIRTRDETTVPLARALFGRAPTPAAVSALTVEEIAALIRDCTFPEPKARQIHAIAGRVAKDYGGQLPCDPVLIRSFHGVGPKCANLTLGIACGQPRIGVDIHVHRITNRWGYVQAKTPEATLAGLEACLPREYWVEINRLLVPFGKHVCTGTLPRCSACPLLDMCRQVGVTAHR